MNKIAIIGGSGFIGTRLIESLDENSCINLDKQNSLKFPNITKICDICDKDFIHKFPDNIETVVLLAAEHQDNISSKSLYYKVNVEGTKNVIEAMEKAKVKNIIFTSSVSLYGLSKKNSNENDAVAPFDDYGKSKYEAEKILHHWYLKDKNNRSLTIIRPAVIFGEGNKGNVYNLLKQIVSKRFVMIGDGSNKKSMAYVENIAAFIKFHTSNVNPQFQVLNYVDNPDYSMNELVNKIKRNLNIKTSSFHLPCWVGLFVGYFFDCLSKITGKKYPISSIRIKKFCSATQFDATKAYSTGFRAPYTLEEGLDRTIQYESKRFNKKYNV